jgi:TonB-linked SusC/RagA family outer membrane protein
MYKHVLISLCLAGLCPIGIVPVSASGQTAAHQSKGLVSGEVVDESGQPVIGASVVVAGKKTGVATDIDGRFTLSAQPNEKITISSIGYLSQTLSAGNGPLRVVLKENTSQLDEVVVIGYGTSKKRDVTGSISSVKAKDLNTTASSSVSQMLQGKVTGMNAIQGSAQPGASISINIRGAASPSGDNSPLYVIDGVPMQTNSTADPGIFGYDYKTGVSRDPLNSINPNDIESIDVLKDASAAAIYGASAANGVILITTKSGKQGRVNVNYSGTFTAQIRKSYPEVMGAQQFREQANLWTQEYYLYSNKMGVYGNNPIDLSGYVKPFESTTNYTADTNWLDEVSQTGYINDQNISVNGGTDRTKYFLSYNYYNNVGMLKQSGLTRNSVRLNLDQKFSKRFSGAIKMTYSNNVANSTSTGDSGQGDNMMVYAYRFAPDLPVKDEDGNYTRSYNKLINNPVSYTEIEDKTKTQRVFVAPSLQFNIIDGLSFKVVGGYDNQQSVRRFYIPVSAANTSVINGFANLGEATVVNASAEGYFNYDKSFSNGNHRISAVLGFGWYKTTSEGFGMSARGFYTDAFGVDNIGIASDKDQEGIQSWRSERTKLSQFARFNYTLLNKYIFTVTARRDGSSYFAKNNKWGIFPSASVAWQIQQENFLRDFTPLTDLKLRVGYGSVGNENVIGTNSLSAYTTGYDFLIGSTMHSGIALTRIENPDLKWETDYTLNLGLDCGWFNNRLTGTIEYYHRGVKDLLDYQTLPSNNAVGRVAANIGETKSEGFELSLHSYNIAHPKFTWETTLNLSYMKASWVKRNPEVALADYIGETDAIDQIYGWKTDGIITSAADIPSYMPEGQIGNIKYVDINGDGVLDSKDVVKLGNSTPRWVLGFGNTWSWKGFDLNIYFYGAFGMKKNRSEIPDLWYLGANSTAPGNTFKNVATDVYNSITGTGWMPGVATNVYDSYNPSGVNDFYLMDASYVKLKNITLGYSLPAKLFVNNKYIQGARFFIDVQNVATFTGYKGFDPELDTTLPYPQALSLSFGFNISL